MGVDHATSNVPITYYFPSVYNMYMCQGLSSDCNNIGFCMYKYNINAMFHTHTSIDPINKCIPGQLEELAGVLKLEFIHRSVICKGVGDLRMYDHGLIYMDICLFICIIE